VHAAEIRHIAHPNIAEPPADIFRKSTMNSAPAIIPALFLVLCFLVSGWWSTNTANTQLFGWGKNREYRPKSKEPNFFFF